MPSAESSGACWSTSETLSLDVKAGDNQVCNSLSSFSSCWALRKLLRTAQAINLSSFDIGDPDPIVPSTLPNVAQSDWEENKLTNSVQRSSQAFSRES